MNKKIRHIFEAIGVYAIYAIMRLLPLDMASHIGGWIFRHIGPYTPLHQVAMNNISLAFPEMHKARKKQIALGMWDNLGRVMGEYPHLGSRAMQERLKNVEGLHHLLEPAQAGRPIFFISGHIGNWELPPVVAAMQSMPLHLLYRQANNPHVEKLIARIRSKHSRGLHHKGRQSARGVIAAMRAKEPVGMLVDQKTNDGLPAMFFNRTAMTTTAVAHMVEKFNPVVLPARCIRLHGAHFRVVIEPPMQFAAAGDATQNRQAILNTINQKLEQWICEYPEQWFWVHKRWPKEELQT